MAHDGAARAGGRGGTSVLRAVGVIPGTWAGVRMARVAQWLSVTAPDDCDRGAARVICPVDGVRR